MSSTGTLETGTVVAGRYRIDETLGGEGSSAAYRATDLRLERAVGLRLLPAADGAQHGKAAARLVHPNVARVLDFGADAELGAEFVVADLGTGGSLAALLAQRGTPPLPLAMRIVQEAAAGLAVAHRAGLVHGDLHPGVLWLSRDEGRLRVQVLGLGLNPAAAPPARATARYASPERLRRGRELLPASDVFSLGVVAYEVFAGLPAEWTSLLLSMARGQAVMAPSLLDARPDLPAHVAQAVRRALLADPAQRWPDAGELAAHLIAESAAAPAPQPAAAPVAAPAPEPAITAASFAAHVAEAAAPAEDDVVDAAADAAEPVATDAVEPQPVVAAVTEAEPIDTAAAIAIAPEPVAEPAVVADAAPVAAPAIAAIAASAVVAEAVAEPMPAAPVAADPAPAAPKRQPPARVAKPIAAAKTDLADSLYIPPAIAKPAPRAEPPAPPVQVAAAAPKPEPAPVKPEPLGAVIEPRPVLEVAPPPAPAPVVAPVLEPVALTLHTPQPLAVAEVDAPSAELVAIPGRRRTPGLARLGQPAGGQRRVLLAASIAAVVLVGGAVVAKTVLAGGSATPPAAAASALAAAGTATPQPQQPAVQAPVVAPLPPVDSAALAALTPEERKRQEDERRKLEEQRRLQQRQRDSLRQAQLATQQLAAQQQAAQQAAVPQQVALATPRPAASAPAPQLEQRAPAAPTATETAAPPPSAPARPRADPSRVYGGGEVDQPPSLSNGSAFRSAVNRTYPATLRNSGQWGNALVSFTVGPDGRVERGSISVDQASHPAFRAAATAAISAARFNPARVDGQPVRAQVSMPITWQGGGQEDED
jgi:TonB family protein